ncbi:MAG: hypothetical protein V3V18_11595 [Methylococcales bacterium]
MEHTESNVSGTTVFGLIGITFVALKLTGYINWFWWWVTVPFWGVFALMAGSILATCIFMVCYEFVEKHTGVNS